MKKILFDMTVYQTGTQFHGGGEYNYTVLKTLMEKKDPETKVDIFIGERGRKDDVVLDKCRQAGIKVYFCRNAEELGKIVLEGRYDTLYSSLPTSKYFRNLKLPADVLMIATIHGLRKLELREGGMYNYFCSRNKIKSDIKEILIRTLQPQKYMKFLKDEYSYLLNITDHYIIVTSSYHSFYNTLRYFPEIGKERLRMYYAPYKLATTINDEPYEIEVLKRYGIRDKNFGLMISANRLEKNPIRGLKAWDIVYEECSDIIPKDFKTVVLGAVNAKKFRKIVNNPERFIFKGYVEDKELEVLYKHTHLLLFASLNEGFGYPPMEAMKYGTLVASSVNTSIPESCGDATLMFNPLIVSEITNRILQSFDSNIRMKKSKKILEQYDKILRQQNMDLENIVKMILTEK